MDSEQKSSAPSGNAAAEPPPGDGSKASPLVIPRKPRYGDRLQVEITGLTDRGQGKARFHTLLGPDKRYREFMIEVRRAIPGDHVEMVVDRCKRSEVSGGIGRLLRASPMRIDPRCQHFGPREIPGKGCGGCALQQLSYADQLKLKHDFVTRSFAKANLDLEVLPVIGQENPWLYRNKMEFSFRPVDNDVNLGLFPLGWRRQVLNLEDCALLSETTGPLLRTVRQWARDEGLEAFDSRGNKGFLRTLMVREGKRTGDRMLVLTTSHQPSVSTQHGPRPAAEVVGAFRDMILAFATKADITITTVVWMQHRAVKGERTRFILETLHGSGTLLEQLHLPGHKELEFEIHPQAFFQPNTRQAEVLYGQVIQAAAPAWSHSARVMDLYCGTGTIGLCVAPYVAHVIGVEMQPDAVDNARRNAAHNHLTNVTFYVGDVAKVLAGELADTVKAQDIDLVIVDPPRSGLIGEAPEHIEAIGAPRLVYVSCNPVALGRDLARLQNQYDIVRVQPVDMFPQTAHVETVVELVHR